MKVHTQEYFYYDVYVCAAQQCWIYMEYGLKREYIRGDGVSLLRVVINSLQCMLSREGDLSLRFSVQNWSREVICL